MTAAIILCAALLGEVVTWPAPKNTAGVDGYAVRVNGKPVDVMGTPKPTYGLGEGRAYPYSFALFDADEEVEIEVSSSLPMKGTRVLPSRLGVMFTAKDEKRVVFRARPPFNLVVEPSGRHHALVIGANLPERDAPKKEDANVVWFGPGRHRLDRQLKIGDNQTLYLAPGAWVEGAVLASGTNVTIRGRGVLSGAPWDRWKGPAAGPCELRGRNLVLRDITVLGSWGWTVYLNGVETGCVDGIRILCGKVLNDDGIDVGRSRNVTIRNCLVRTQDDCICAKFHCENMLVENCALWADFANNIRIGFECDGAARPFRNIRYRGIDILHQTMFNDKPADGYWSENAINVQASGGTTIEDLVFEDFRFESPQAMDLLFSARTLICRYPPKEHTEGGHVRNVVVRNMELPKDRPLGAYGVWIQSLDDDHIVENVTFENIRNFQVPAGVRGKTRNIVGLPPLTRN